MRKEKAGVLLKEMARFEEVHRVYQLTTVEQVYSHAAALTEGGELTHEAVGEYSLTVDAPAGPGSALLLDVGNEGRIRDQLVE